MSHKLYLGMYIFSIKKRYTQDAEKISNNDFLESAYIDLDKNKFSEGFAQDVIKLMDEKVFKTQDGTQGGILDQEQINEKERKLDLLVNGGNSGIKQFIIDEDGNKQEISDKDIVGPKFFARFWLPAGTKTGYVFIQKYGVISIKPLFDSILKELLRKRGFSFFGVKRLKPTTTKARLDKFLKKAILRDVSIISEKGINNTGEPEASSVTIKLKRFNNYKEVKEIDKEYIDKALNQYGIFIEDRNYKIRGTYEYDKGKDKQERTVDLDGSEDTINIIPNTIIPNHCIDQNNYPIFERLSAFIDQEIEQVRKEAKL